MKENNSKNNDSSFFKIDPTSVPEPSLEDAKFFGENHEVTRSPVQAKPSAADTNNADTENADEEKPTSKPQNDEHWERPTPMAHDHHYKSWMAFIGLALIAIAFYRPIKVFIHKWIYQAPVSTAERNATEFIALAYYGIEESPAPGSSSVSAAMFKEQMKLLKSEGYTPITLKDVRDFYKLGTLLPNKAVLLTFEQAKRSTYNQVRDILQSYKWPAVMGVNTLAVHSMNPETLLWHYLREMHDLGYWELAAESYLGFTEIETAPNDASATFFTSPMWIQPENRYEMPSEFEIRIMNDHKAVIDEFTREVKDKPIAFFFPLGNYGQYDERAQVIRSVNLRQIEKNYDLGFTIGMLALNSKNSDPRRLNRLLVDPSWSPNAFISMVDSFWPRSWSEDAKTTATYTSSSWLTDWGEVYSRGNTLILNAIPSLDEIDDLKTGTSSGTTGAKAWLIGSDTFKDGHVSMLFNMRRGRFGIYLRATNQGEYIFISIDERGNISARQKLSDVEELILASDVMSTDVSISHNITVHLRDRLLFVQLDGKILFGGRIILRGEPRPGLIGASIWDSLTGVAATEIISTRISGRRDAVVSWSQETGRNGSYLNKWLTENAFRFAIISPPWIDIISTGMITANEWDVPAVSLVATSNGARVFPAIKVQNVEAIMKIVETTLSEKAKELGVDGIFIDASSCDETKMPALVSWLTRINESLRDGGMGLMLQLPTGFVRLSSSINIIKIIPDVILVGDNLEAFKLPTTRALPIIFVPPSDFNQTLNYYYQVANILAEYNDISGEAQNEELRQKGFEAFASKAYDEAISEWSIWAKKDPENAEPLSLIGDALLKKDEKIKASEFYAACLEKNPGQVNLAVRQSQLLFDMGKVEEATKLMDVYARTFPDNAEICIAQARWLSKSRRRSDARDLMRGLVASQPKNVQARLVLQNYLDEPTNRYDNMHQLLNLAKSSEASLYGFAQEIISSELLTVPEATIFFPFIRNIAENGPNTRTKGIYDQLLPLTNSVIEDFTKSYLSEAWIPWDGMHSPASGKYELHASPSVSEAFLRLKKSELMRDGKLSVVIDESIGSFWLYARRSSRSMLRFGYDNDGYIRMQTWFDGQIRSAESQPWLRPPGIITLSLEIRGDGAMGLENGRPLFPTRIKIPRETCYGWWSIAPYSPTLGSAKASILKIEVSPLPSGLALLPILDSEKIPAVLETLRQNVRDISILAPVAIKQHPNGSVSTEPEIDLGPYKMFCAFHRLRLIPVVEMPYFAMVKPSLLTDIINKHNLEGIILRVTSMPPESWFEELEKTMEQTAGNLLVVQSIEPLWPNMREKLPITAKEEYLRLKTLDNVQIREIQLGNLILPPVQDTWMISPLPLQEWVTQSSEQKREGIKTRLIIVPLTGSVSPEDLESVQEEVEANTRKNKKEPPVSFEFTSAASTLQVPDVATNVLERTPALTNQVEKAPAPLPPAAIVSAVTNTAATRKPAALLPASTVSTETNTVPKIEKEEQSSLWKLLEKK